MMIDEPHIDPKDLSSIRVETTVIAGERDLVSYEESKRIADHIPGAKLRIIEKAGHGDYIVHNERIAYILLEEVK